MQISNPRTSEEDLNSEEAGEPDIDNIDICTNILKNLRADGIRLHVQPSGKHQTTIKSCNVLYLFLDLKS